MIKYYFAFHPKKRLPVYYTGSLTIYTVLEGALEYQQARYGPVVNEVRHILETVFNMNVFI